MPMLKEVVIHLGAHKTASTSLQVHLDQVAKRFSGIAYFGPRAIRRGLALPALSALTRPDGSALGTEQRIQAAVDELLCAGGDRVLISYEGLLGEMIGKTRALYPHAELTARAFEALMSRGVSVRALLFVRDQASLLQSAYLFRVLWGYPHGPEEFLAGVDTDGLDWRQVVTPLHGALGARLTVWPYRAFAEDERRLLDELAEQHEMFGGIGSLPRVNTALHPCALFVAQQALAHGVKPRKGVARFCQRLERATATAIARDAPGEVLVRTSLVAVRRAAQELPRGWRGVVRDAVTRYADARERGTHPLSLGDAKIAAIRQQYRGSNVDLLERYVAPRWRGDSDTL